MMDVAAFVDTQAKLFAAKVTAFALSSNELQTAADAWATFKEDFGPAFTAANLALWAYGPEFGLETGGDLVTDGAIEDAQDTFSELVGATVDPGDRAETGNEADSTTQESAELNLPPAANDNAAPAGAAANDNLAPITPAPLPNVVPAASPPPVPANDNPPAPETPPAPTPAPAAPTPNVDTQV